jgi:hypothetical protein
MDIADFVFSGFNDDCEAFVCGRERGGEGSDPNSASRKKLPHTYFGKASAEKTLLRQAVTTPASGGKQSHLIITCATNRAVCCTYSSAARRQSKPDRIPALASIMLKE